MGGEGYLLEICSGRAAWQVQPDDIKEIELAAVAEKIISDGWECTLQNRLCYTFSGEVDLTLFPSGKLLVKSGDRDLVEKIAGLHISKWLN